MSLPWKPLVQKAMPSLYSWGRRRGKLGMKPRASCTWKHPGTVAKQKPAGFVTLGDTLPAPGVGLGQLCHWSCWDLRLVVPGEPQPYHEGVSLGAERVGQPVDGEGQVRHRVEVAALHGILEHSRGLRMSLPAGRGAQALSPPAPTLALTSPSTDTAPIRFCSSLISLVGPVMSDVPVSTMAWQPLAQKVTVPPSWMLEEGRRSRRDLSCPPSPALPSPPAQHHSLVQLDLPVPLLGDRHPVQGACEAGGVKAPKKQLSSLGGLGVPAGRRRRRTHEGFFPI